MSLDGANTLWKYNRISKKWKEMPRFELKDIELNVLKYSAMGYTMNEIADLVHRSFDSVKVYRKTILEKTYKSAEKEAQNMQQKLNNVEQYLGKDISKEQTTEHTPRHIGI